MHKPLTILRVIVILALLLVPVKYTHAGTEESKSVLKKLSENVKLVTLRNGLRVILYRRATAPVFAGFVSVRVGGVDEKRGETGISHMLEHMAFKGTPLIGTKDYAREKVLLEQLERLAVKKQAEGSLDESEQAEWDRLQKELATVWDNGAFDREYKRRGGVGLNATTSKELTNYFINLPKPSFEYWAFMESERFVNPVMRQFYKERDVVMEERRQRFEDDPDGKLYEQLLGVAYLQHPYRNPVIGYEQEISTLTATQTREFHKKFYVAENIVVGVVGDIDYERDVPILEKYFGRISSAPRPAPPAVVEPEQQGERELVLEYDAAPNVAILYKKLPYPHPDDAAVTLMLEMLASTKVSPLYKELVQKKQVATGIVQYEGPGVLFPNLILFYLQVKQPHSTTRVISEFDKVVAQFIKQPVDESLFEIAKRSIAVSYLTGLKDNMSLARDLATSELVYGDWRTITKWYDEMLAVTSDDVKRVAKKYLVKNKRTIGRLERKKSEAKG